MNSRAWLRIVEVAIAGAMLLVFFAYISSLITIERPSLEETSDLARAAQQTLFILDNTKEGSNSILESRILDSNFAKLHEQTREVLSDNYRFRYTIGNQETGGLPPKTEVFHQTYFAVLPNGDTETVRLFVWRRD